MDNMILSPMQQDDVTRGEFEGLKTSMNTRFDEQEEYTKDGFEKVFEQIGAVEQNMISRFGRIEGRLGVVEEKVDGVIDQMKLLTQNVNSIGSQVKVLTQAVNSIDGQVKVLTRAVNSMDGQVKILTRVVIDPSK